MNADIPRDEVTAHTISHGLLVAVLMHLGGSITLPLEHLTDESSMGNAFGELYGVGMDHPEPGQVRLSLVPVSERLGEDGAS